MTRDYRGSRVNVTPEIKAKVYELLKKESDFQKKKRHTATWYQDKVAEQLNLTEEGNPSLRSYEHLILELKKILKTPNPLNSPWSIGSCEEYNIPADIIPTLIERERIGLPKFTIRQARWYARLKPVVYEMSAAKRPLEDALAGLSPVTLKGVKISVPAPYDDSRLALLEFITYCYAGAEELSELNSKQSLDTSDLDFTIFTKGEIVPGGHGEPVHVDVTGVDPKDIPKFLREKAFELRFQTDTLRITGIGEKNERLNNQEK